VYSESLGEAITREHAQKLATDLGCAPVALFQAPFDLAIQRGERALDPTGSRATAARRIGSLALALSLGQAVEAKRAALEASLAGSATCSLASSARSATRAEAHEIEARARPALLLGEAVARGRCRWGRSSRRFVRSSIAGRACSSAACAAR
jgi:hypothetical protein